MIACYPDKIRKLPQFDDFLEDIESVGRLRKELFISFYSAERLRNFVAKKYGISRTPMICSEKCPYYKLCEAQNKKTRDRIKQYLSI